MKHPYPKQALVYLLVAIVSLASLSFAPSAVYQPVFRDPVVPGAVISGYFDHNRGNDLVTHYNGYGNRSPDYGFIFTCASVGMYDFVGCVDNVAGEGACSNDRELWYDGHKGTDYEYATNWHTGAYCDPNRFAGVTKPVYAPAAGKVLFAGYDPNRPANGWHIRLKHDLNRNGNYDDDNFRSIYLHFTANALAVTPGQVVAEGQYLGLGGSTGYSSSPHLHFEVQRSADYFQSTYWSVDPFGWQGQGADPWPYQNVVLFRKPDLNLSQRLFLPVTRLDPVSTCSDCGPQLQNGGFEAGAENWSTVGVDIIVDASRPRMTASPYAGNWFSWLGGRNGAEDRISQDFYVPAGVSSFELRYFVHIDTQESGGVYDTLAIRLRRTDGSNLRTISVLDNTFSPGNRWVEQVVRVDNAGEWSGQTIRLSFEASTDGSAVTSFYIDEVSIR